MANMGMAMLGLRLSFLVDRAGISDMPGPNLYTEMTVEFSVAFYSSTLHIYYLSLYWPDLKHKQSHVML